MSLHWGAGTCPGTSHWIRRTTGTEALLPLADGKTGTWGTSMTCPESQGERVADVEQEARSAESWPGTLRQTSLPL